MSRYARQMAVKEFGASGQQSLQRAGALVIGAGGLAAPVLQYLVGAGIGWLRLVDPDEVELSNLHRQTLFRIDDLGTKKAIAAANHMKALNSDTKIEPLVTWFNPANATALTEGVDLVLDCADSFAASYVASDLCLEHRIPLISASVVGRTGYSGGFCGDSAPGLRAVFPDLPEQLGSCATDGVLGPAVGVVGALQADMAVRVLAHLEPSPLGQLITFDEGARTGGFRFDDAPNPDSNPAFVATEDIKSDDFLVDLRAADEPGPPLQAARRLTVDTFGPGGPVPANNQRAIIACRSGLRAWQAAKRLSQVWDGEIKLLALGDRQISKQ